MHLQPSVHEPSPGDIKGLLAPHRGRVVALAMTSLGGGLAEAAFLVAVTRAAFAITDGKDRVGVFAGWTLSTTQVVLLMLALVIVRVALAVAGAWQSARLGSTIVASIRRDLARAFLRSTWSAQHGERTGRLQELLTTFAQQGAVLVNSLTQSIASGFSLLALLVSAIVVDPTASVAVIVAVVILGFAIRPLRAAVRRQAKETSSTGMEFATSLSEISQLGMEMHVFGVQQPTAERVDDLVGRNEEATRRLTFLRGLVPAVYSGLAYIALVAALAAAAAVDSANLTSVGAVMLLMLRSLSYGQGLQTNSATINSSLPFLGALDDELARYSAAAVIDHGQPIGEVGDLVLDDVSFEYSADVPVLRNITATIDAHEVIGVVGPSGSGKSTLVQVLLGLREPTNGRVLSAGRDIRVLSKIEWARKVTFVPQDAHLIGGTVADNIRFLRADVTDEDVERAARLAHLHVDVTGWKEGYHRQVGEQGSHLSGGQKQRLIIARALVEQPDVLILDEPTSALDVQSESLIRQTLSELRDRMTILIIAHRLSTLDICDRIMVVQDGELKAFETPDNLEKKSGFFRDALILSGLR